MIDAEKLVRAAVKETLKQVAELDGHTLREWQQSVDIDPATIIARVAPAEPVARIDNDGRLKIQNYNALDVGAQLYAAPVVAAPAPVDEAAERAEFERIVNELSELPEGAHERVCEDDDVNAMFIVFKAGRAALREEK